MDHEALTKKTGQQRLSASCSNTWQCKTRGSNQAACSPEASLHNLESSSRQNISYNPVHKNPISKCTCKQRKACSEAEIKPIHSTLQPPSGKAASTPGGWRTDTTNPPHALPCCTLPLERAAPRHGHTLTSPFFLRHRRSGTKLLNCAKTNSKVTDVQQTGKRLRGRKNKTRGVGNSKSTLHYTYGTSKQQRYITCKYCFSPSFTSHPG